MSANVNNQTQTVSLKGLYLEATTKKDQIAYAAKVEGEVVNNVATINIIFMKATELDKGIKEGFLNQIKQEKSTFYYSSRMEGPCNLSAVIKVDTYVKNYKGPDKKLTREEDPIVNTIILTERNRNFTNMKTGEIVLVPVELPISGSAKELKS